MVGWMAGGCSGGKLAQAGDEVESLRVEVLAKHPHDPGAFTQGLEWHEGALFESTGLEGRSSVRMVEPASGRVLLKKDLPAKMFGEGLALVGEKLIQLTWQNGVALVYDAASLKQTGEMRYEGEGWGLAYDGKHLVMSDGSAVLQWRRAEDFGLVTTRTVTLAGKPLGALNELEFAGGVLWANVWQQDRIVRIDPATGKVTGVVAAGGLLSAAERGWADVLNGIAYNKVLDRFFITGKLWPWLFEVRFVPAK
ncbi:glutaminyl-peptide cyclotransferase [candidate division BRC1 bacterium HGW-BRC1-1]|nr:MAG: glutaminyl-peptide cyclotransferase [candidate division BRC1 bacterium HGW-BRC1-1]